MSGNLLSSSWLRNKGTSAGNPILRRTKFCRKHLGQEQTHRELGGLQRTSSLLCGRFHKPGLVCVSSLTRLVFHAGPDSGLGMAGSGNRVLPEEEEDTEASVQCCNEREPLRWTQLCVTYQVLFVGARYTVFTPPLGALLAGRLSGSTADNCIASPPPSTYEFEAAIVPSHICPQAEPVPRRFPAELRMAAGDKGLPAGESCCCGL